MGDQSHERDDDRRVDSQRVVHDDRNGDRRPDCCDAARVGVSNDRLVICLNYYFSMSPYRFKLVIKQWLYNFNIILFNFSAKMFRDIIIDFR